MGVGRVTRKQIETDLTAKGVASIDVSSFSKDTLSTLGSAKIDRAELTKIAGTNSLIDTKVERDQLHALLDGNEKGRDVYESLKLEMMANTDVAKGRIAVTQIGARLGDSTDAKKKVYAELDALDGNKDGFIATRTKDASGNVVRSAAGERVHLLDRELNDPKRAKFIDHMLRGNDPPVKPELRETVLEALSVFTQKEIEQMDRTGVRLWFGKDLPPDLKDAGLDIDGQLKTAGEYRPGVRVVLMRRNASAETMRHELGHVKDDLLDDPAGLKPIADYKAKDRPGILTQSMKMGTESKKTYATLTYDAEYNLQPKNMSLDDMYKAFAGRGTLREDVFKTEYARDAYARTNAQEFFAEGFAVFHGSDAKQKENLRFQAPELYFYLKADAEARGLL